MFFIYSITVALIENRILYEGYEKVLGVQGELPAKVKI